MMDNGFFADEQKESVLKAEIRCVLAPNSEQLEKIRQFIIDEYNVPDVECVVKIDPAVVGGFNILVCDYNYD